MTDPMTHQELIAALKKATGPDRELDAKIYVATAELPEGADKIWAVGDSIFWAGGSVTQGPLYLKGRDYLAYTASIDAAMTLVPPEHGYYVRENCSSDGDEIYCNAQVWPYSDPRDTEAPRYWANSKQGQPAIALCIAALRARALNSKDET